jgi:hypothetical protein
VPEAKVAEGNCDSYPDCDKRFTGIENSLKSLKKSIAGLVSIIKGFNGALKGHGTKIGDLEKKVFNGFGTTISHVEKKVDSMALDMERIRIEAKKDNYVTRGMMFTLLIMFVMGLAGNALLQTRNAAVGNERLIELIQDTKDEIDNKE